MSLTSSLNAAVSALNAFTTGLQVISNNISNINTVGYKSSRTDYSDSFSGNLRQHPPQAPDQTPTHCRSGAE